MWGHYSKNRPTKKIWAQGSEGDLSYDEFATEIQDGGGFREAPCGGTRKQLGGPFWAVSGFQFARKGQKRRNRVRRQNPSVFFLRFCFLLFVPFLFFLPQNLKT